MKKKVYAIIQARMGSARLPGKVLRNLCGKPMLWHIIERLKKCRELTGVAIATSESRDDNEIVRFAEKYRIKIIRGSEDDVLKRYIDAGMTLKADYVVRITGDTPLIEPSEIDRMIRIIKKRRADFIRGYHSIPSVHEGFIVVTLSALVKTYQAEDLKSYHKEHVTIYLNQHPKFVKTAFFKPRKIFQKRGYRLSVDTMADFKFMEEVYAKFWNGRHIVDLKKIVRYVEKNPEIKDINKHVSRKRIDEKSKKIAFIIEGGNKLGFGHFVRASQIAGYLTERRNCGTIFFTDNLLLCEKLKEHGFKNFFDKRLFSERTHTRSLVEEIKKEHIGHIVIDVKTDHNPSRIIRILRKRSRELKITLIDNRSAARLLADKNIYPGLAAGIKKLSWKNYKGKVYCGIKYFPLRREFTCVKKVKKEKNSIVVSMGASDPKNLTLFAIKKLIETKKRVKVILGPGFKFHNKIETFVRQHKRVFKIINNPNNYPSIIASSAAAITALGISIYEFSFLGIPALVIGNYRDDARSGLYLEKKGYCKYLGFYKDVSGKQLSEVLSLYVPKSGIRTPDEYGVMRIANVIVS